jgi:2-phospho-L-lactate transferase/gluconeogenesis factor (CofD/UPF0052 family)
MHAADCHTSVEQLVEVVLRGPETASHEKLQALANRVLDFAPRDTRVVVLGGGTGLSTVVGGNSAMPDWAEDPFVGLKRQFAQLDVIVCTTDDGGSTGRLLKRLPMIAVGDLRKSCVSLVREQNLRDTYSLDSEGLRRVAACIQQVHNYRFPERDPNWEVLEDPLLAAAPELRAGCPEALASWFRALGRLVCPAGAGPTIDPTEHCLGNLLLTAALFKAAGGRTDRAPTQSELETSLDEVARHIGMTPGQLHAATATPGQLRFRYANGVEVYGQHKAGQARRGFPVQRVIAEFAGEPVVSQGLCRLIREADLIIYAPGSVYSSIIPVLQLEPIVEAVRSNRKALKVLGANFWIQRGETDISLHHQERGFLVSELIEAYDQNVPGGVRDLFQVVLCATLEHVPGHVLRNYALEGKRAIHLDRRRVEAMGLEPVEAALFSRRHLELSGVIHHDSGNFALAVRALWYAHRHPEALDGAGFQSRTGIPEVSSRKGPRGRSRRRGPLLCDYLESMRVALEPKTFRPESLRSVLLELAWENRDIQPAHLGHFDGARVVADRDWGRSTEWDNVLGYFDPQERVLKIHEQLLSNPEKLRESLLIALGESLLGRYIWQRHWSEGRLDRTRAGRCYEIHLRPPEQRECFLDDEQLRTYLRLARMIQDPEHPHIYRLSINGEEGFLPSGLLFGLLFAWYLNSAYGGAMEYDMSLLRWPAESLMPHHAQERARKQALVRFFCEDVFGHRPE